MVEKIELYDDEEMKLIEEQESLDQQMMMQEQQRYIMQQIQENEQFISMPMVDGELMPSFQQNQNPAEVVISTALDPEMKIKKNYQRSEENAPSEVKKH